MKKKPTKRPPPKKPSAKKAPDASAKTKAKVEACAKEVQEVLDKHGCIMTSSPVQNDDVVIANSVVITSRIVIQPKAN